MITPEQLAAPNTEHAHQVALFAAIALYRNEATILPSRNVISAQLNLLFAIPNGGERNKAVAGRLKAEGVKAGVFDLFLPVPRRYYDPKVGSDWQHNGLFIEMKKPDRRNHKNGGLSDEQRTFMQNMMQQGYYCVACYTWQEAFAAIMNYLGVSDANDKAAG